MSLRNIFRSPRLASRNLRYVVFYNKNLFLSKSPLRGTFPMKEMSSFTIEPVRTYCTPVGGAPGSGAGTSGGAGGSIRESGGALGKYGAANEEGYFYSKQKEQLRKIKDKLQKKDKELSQKPEKP